jgi:hypothetical protein
MTENLPAIAHVIQLSVAPVFLLTGIGAILGVMMSRLGRIVDRARVLEVKIEGLAAGETSPIHDELHTLARRARLINLAITLGVLSALLICAVIVGLFAAASDFAWASNVIRAVAAVFAIALLSLIGALLVLLREVYLATATLRINIK